MDQIVSMEGTSWTAGAEPLPAHPVDPPQTTTPLDLDLQFISKQAEAVKVALQKPNEYNPKAEEDIFDWLQAIFGFQKASVANQREHLTMLLINYNIQHCPSGQHLDDSSVREVMEKVLRSSDDWCEFMGPRLEDRKFSLQNQLENEEKQWRNLLFTGMYLLIWGEAANLRFMPECLSYIYHKMAEELWGILEKEHESEKVEREEAFLQNVVTPIYDVIRNELKRCNQGKSTHSQWRNYDDLNEYFWSDDCFQLDWPLKTHANFFNSFVEPKKGLQENKPAQKKDKWTGKVNFIEIRSFWHIFRSFDRMWSFLILALQAMVIVAFNGSGHPFAIFKINVFSSSIFITASIMKFGQALLDVVLDVHEKLRRNVLKLVFGVVLVSMFIYAYFWEKPSMYYWTVVLYLTLIVLSEISLLPFDYKIVMLLKLLWFKPRLFVGREMHASAFSYFTYTLFWVMLLGVKLLFSYYIEILPLVSPTKTIMQFDATNFKWNDFFHDQHKMGVVISLWAPIILVYFLDTQIWYAVLSTLVGFLYGACYHLGEIRSLGILRSRFNSSYDKLYERLIPTVETNHQEIDLHKDKETAHLWNEIIGSMRNEDLISNGEFDKLRFPFWADNHVEGDWPLFVIASKISTALEMAKDPESLIDSFRVDYCMCIAVRKCYESLKEVIYRMVIRAPEISAIKRIFDKVDQDLTSMEIKLDRNYSMSDLASLHKHVVELTKLLLDNNANKKDQVRLVFLNMLKVVRNDIMRNNSVPEARAESPSELSTPEGATEAREESPSELFTSDGAIDFPINDYYWPDKIKRLHLWLTLKESVMDVPSNLEARRRLIFFSNSLFMDMPSPPRVRKMLSFSVLTPYYDEDVLFSREDLERKNEDGVDIQYYLKKNFPDEWLNFVERIASGNENNIGDEDLCLWASYRGQTLFRTVRGIMYYRQALFFQAFREESNNNEGLRAIQPNIDEDSGFNKFCREIVDMKFTYVVSCQQYGRQKKSGDPKAQDILKLMTKYPSLGVAYVVEEEDRSKPTNINYYSVLAKADKVIYRIKLPGQPILGEGKPENQNHAIIFTRGVTLQTIDMNQDNYMEEALKMRNLLEEFRKMHGGVRYPTILGVREHIYTGSVSSVARFMSNQELSFVTIGQRMLANPLKVRFHYGHPDVFDRLFHITRGGVSKASKVINLSEDIFAGFNSTLRGGDVTHHEYIQVGKGRDLGFDNISMFESKIASGNGEQTISRDIYRLGHGFDFFRMLSLYYTTVGFYFSNLITVLAVYIFLYGRLYLLLSGFDDSFNNKALQDVLAPQSIVQIGFLLGFPMLMEIGLEKGFSTALSEFIFMNLQLAPVFFIFSIGTKIHYYGRTLLHGGAKYRSTGRGFVLHHTKFVDIYKLYSRSHFVKAIELMIILTVYEIFSQPHKSTSAYMLTSKSIWFMVGTWLFAPFLFNPSGFEWHNIVVDWCEWNKWISNVEESGVAMEKSWEWWWKEEQEHLHHSGFLGIVAEILLSLRFFIYHHGLVHYLMHNGEYRSLHGHAQSWMTIFLIVILIILYLISSQTANPKNVLEFRFGKWYSCLTFGIGFVAVHLTLQSFVLSILGIISAFWGLLQIAQARSSFVKKIGLWFIVKTFARGYEYVMGLLLFIPVAILAWFPFVSDFQTRILFNQSFSRGLHISRILEGHDK